MTIRKARAEDAAAISEIQRASAEAAQWDPAGYEVSVAEADGAVVGFLVVHPIDEQELEILNLAVTPSRRRTGVARALVKRAIEQHPGEAFLEVRESNSAARKLYQSIGFKEVNRRSGYYESPPESAVVMKFHSC